MEKLHKSQDLVTKKRKRKSSATESADTQPKNLNTEPVKTVKKKISNETSEKKAKKSLSLNSGSPKKVSSEKKSKKSKKKLDRVLKEDGEEKCLLKLDKEIGINKKSKKDNAPLSVQETEEKYPVLVNKELISKFLQVQLNNNQKGRIRQALKMSLQGAPLSTYPDLIHSKIQAILKSSQDLTDSDLRRIRILYNMLKTALESPQDLVSTEVQKKEDGEKKEVKPVKEQPVKPQKGKGPKRYVVFLGNLPLNVTKEQIMSHFAELNESIKDIRIPKPAEGKKSLIAFVELMNEPSFELALSKHHSMLGSKRINVLYTAQKNGKITASKAKGKSAKLIALQKSGKLVGSIPLNKKRSHRRAIMKKATAAAQQQT